MSGFSRYELSWKISLWGTKPSLAYHFKSQKEERHREKQNNSLSGLHENHKRIWEESGRNHHLFFVTREFFTIVYILLDWILGSHQGRGMLLC